MPSTASFARLILHDAMDFFALPPRPPSLRLIEDCAFSSLRISLFLVQRYLVTVFEFTLLRFVHPSELCLSVVPLNVALRFPLEDGFN
jgi:hypothetical protein